MNVLKSLNNYCVFVVSDVKMGQDIPFEKCNVVKWERKGVRRENRNENYEAAL